MVDYSKIFDCFKTLVGWNPSADDCVDIDLVFDEEDEDPITLGISDSGVWFNDYPGVTLSLAQKALDKDSADLMEYLTKAQKAAIRDAVHAYLKRHKAEVDTKSVLANFELGSKPKNIRTTVVGLGRFVGVTFRAHGSMPVSVRIEDLSFGAVLNPGASTDLNLYLYEESSFDAIATYPIVIEDKKIAWQGTKITLDLNNGQEYLLGYYENDLDGAAISTNKSCSNCSSSPSKKYSPYLFYNGASIASGNTYLSRELPEMATIGHEGETYGLNFRVTIGCDLTQLFCDNGLLFAKTIQMQMAINFFWNVYNSKNLNADSILSKEDARLMAEKTEIDLKAELKNIVIDFEGIDCACVGSRRGYLRSMGL